MLVVAQKMTIVHICPWHVKYATCKHKYGDKYNIYKKQTTLTGETNRFLLGNKIK